MSLSPPGPLGRLANWHHSEVERCFDTLNQEEQELHQSQMKLFREQMTAFVHDQQLVQEDLEHLKAESNNTIEMFKDFREAQVQSEHAHLLAIDRISQLEQGLQDHGATHTARADNLERMLQDIDGRRFNELSHLQARIDCQSRSLKATEATCDRFAVVASRVENFERQLNGEGPNHTGEHWQLQTACNETCVRLEQLLAESMKILGAAGKCNLGEELQCLQAANSSALNRITTLEKAVQDMSATHGGEIAQLATTVGDRHTALEKAVQDVSLTTGRHLEQLKGNHDGHLASLEQLRDAHERHLTAIEQLRQEQSVALQGVDAMLTGGASLPKRVDFLEGLLGDAADKADREIKSLASAHAAREAAQRGRFEEQLESSRAEVRSKQEVIERRVELVEALFSDSLAEHSKRMKAIMEAHEAHARGLEVLTEAHVHQESVRSRLADIDKLSRRVSELTALKDAQREQGRLVQSIWEAQAALLDRLGRIEVALDSNTCSSEALPALEARLEQLHNAMAFSDANHGEELQRLQAVQQEQLSDRAGVLYGELADLQAAGTRQSHIVLRATLRIALFCMLEQELGKRLQQLEGKLWVGLQSTITDRLGNFEKAVDERFDRMDGRISVVRGVWARDREQLLGGCEHLDQVPVARLVLGLAYQRVSDRLQREAQAKEELTAELREACQEGKPMQEPLGSEPVARKPVALEPVATYPQSTIIPEEASMTKQASLPKRVGFFEEPLRWGPDGYPPRSSHQGPTSIRTPPRACDLNRDTNHNEAFHRI